MDMDLCKVCCFSNKTESDLSISILQSTRTSELDENYVKERKGTFIIY